MPHVVSLGIIKVFFEYFGVTVSWEFAVIVLGLFVFRYRGLLAILFTCLLIYRLELYGCNNFGITLKELGFSLSGDDVVDGLAFLWSHFNITDWVHEAQPYGGPSLLAKP